MGGFSFVKNVATATHVQPTNKKAPAICLQVPVFIGVPWQTHFELINDTDSNPDYDTGSNPGSDLNQYFLCRKKKSSTLAAVPSPLSNRHLWH